MKVLEKVRQVGMWTALAQLGTEPNVDERDFEIPFITSIDSVTELVRAIIGTLLLIAGIVAVIYLIWGGYQYLTAGGDPERATKAKTTIINAIIGIVVVALSYAIFRAVISALPGQV